MVRQVTRVVPRKNSRVIVRSDPPTEATAVQQTAVASIQTTRSALRDLISVLRNVKTEVEERVRGTSAETHAADAPAEGSK